MNKNIGELKMTNLLLENFINEINLKRKKTIEIDFQNRMEVIKNQISNLGKTITKYNDAWIGSLKAELVDHGFVVHRDTSLEANSFSYNRIQRKSITDNFPNLTVIFDLNRTFIEIEDKRMWNNKRSVCSLETYTIKSLDLIKKTVLEMVTADVNYVFDMYLARVVTQIKHIDFCNPINKCDIQTFELEGGYPSSIILIKTENNSECKIKTTLKWNFSKYGRMFGQFPTTIHGMKRDGLDHSGSSYENFLELVSDNFNQVWTEMQAHRKNEKTQKAIKKLEIELSEIENDDPNGRFYNAKYNQRRIKKLNDRLAKEKAKLIDVRAYRDVGQSLLEVA